MSELLRIGTRKSALALVQSHWVAARLREAQPGLRVELVEIRTTGDRILDRPLAEIGGKGLFLKEIEEALLDGSCDVGVHSMKDLPDTLPDGLEIVAVPIREGAEDVLVSAFGPSIDDLPKGARVGSGSLRRASLLRDARPDLEVLPVRGNVGTRLEKWRAGEFEAIVLAGAGLRRLGLDVPEARPLPVDRFVPAIGQGALALEIPADSRWRELLAGLDHPPSAVRARAERAFLSGVGGDCKTPLAAYATLKGESLELRAMIGHPSGVPVVRGETVVEAVDLASAEAAGARLATELLDAGGRDVLATVLAELNA